MTVFQESFVVEEVDQIGESIGDRKVSYVMFVLVAKLKK